MYAKFRCPTNDIIARRSQSGKKRRDTHETMRANISSGRSSNSSLARDLPFIAGDVDIDVVDTDEEDALRWDVTASNPP